MYHLIFIHVGHVIICYFTVVKPEYYSYVFLKANEPVTGVSANEPGSIEEEVIDFDTNDQQLLPYKCVEHLISNSSVHLI